MRSIVLLALATLLCTCAGSNQPAATTATDPAAPVTGQPFGAAFDAGAAIPAATLLTAYSPADLQDTVATTLRGEVNEVCQAKGCWMTVQAGAGQEMMVKFRDYGFFVPKDIDGGEVIMKGIAYYETTPVDELRHYARDAGKTEAEIAAITEPERELKFLADGVLVVNKL